ncbi:hypothetical protein CIB95_13000 [Lottiidibacillus patelloidae]|uniref:Uncharacterized protein n=1 Tax=Lottiidibacillus patelloidae TaxID=2670334 RepID=A0A263BT23_9BACI|nr:DUF3006 domain-containing protein [Lottiidibacillus patelloidae]OZM56326.1 hypothetical protein CIB95_13000 [Lottiidibacillus patelloidae]
MRGIIDRFEGNIVIIEIEGKTKDYSRNNVDSSVKQNDVVVYRDGRWIPDGEETKKRSEKIKKLMTDVWED